MRSEGRWGWVGRWSSFKAGIVSGASMCCVKHIPDDRDVRRPDCWGRVRRACVESVLATGKCEDVGEISGLWACRLSKFLWKEMFANARGSGTEAQHVE